MKDMQFSPLKSDVKFPIVLLCFGVFCLIGYLIPTPVIPTPVLAYYDSHWRLFDAGVSVALGALVWSAFRLIEPRRHGQKWVIAELTVVPIVWLLLMLALVVWFDHLSHASDWMNNNIKE